MVVITADRPAKLRESGAPQTINQIGIYGHYAITTRDLPLPAGNETAISWGDAGRDTLSIISPLNPVAHFNAPFDEPLIPTPEFAAEIVTEEFKRQTNTETATGAREISASDKRHLQEYSTQLAAAERPVIVCGSLNVPVNGATPIVELAQKCGVPILADAASQLRAYPEVVSHGELILRDSRAREFLDPDLILRVGGLPTSRAVNEWVASTSAKTKIGIASTRPADPDRCLTHSLATDVPSAIAAFASITEVDQYPRKKYYDEWMRCEKALAEELKQMTIPAGEDFKPAIVANACRVMHSGMNLFLSNSMPIRWAEMYSGAHAEFPRVFVNRGVNGIDGIISTAAGVARASSQTTVCILGDLTFLHDSNGLWRLMTEQVPIKLVVLNNDGGGVFHFLPVASHAEHFESLVAMPHGVGLSHLAAAHGIPYYACKSRTTFNDMLTTCLERSGPEIIEVQTNRASNFKRHQEIVDHVARATRSALGLA